MDTVELGEAGVIEEPGKLQIHSLPSGNALNTYLLCVNKSIIKST